MNEPHFLFIKDHTILHTQLEMIMSKPEGTDVKEQRKEKEKENRIKFGNHKPMQ